MRASALMAGEAFARLRRQIAKIEANAWVKTRDSKPLAKGDPLPTSPFQGEEPSSACRTPPYPNLGRTPPPEKGRLGGGPLPPVRTPASEAILPLITDGGFPRAPPALSPRRAGAALAFAIPRLDRLLAGGLRRAALHEMRCDESRDAAAMTGFAVALLARLADADNRPVLWVVEAAAAGEAGMPYGTGLAGFGLDPARLIVVRVAKPADALWVFEEGLRCRGLAAVLTEIRGHPRLLDLTASRRLALRAREHGVMGLLLRQSDRAPPGAASTRWLVAPRPASTSPDFPMGIGHPAWRLTLERNRQGATGTFDVEWDHDRRCFAPAGIAVPALSLPVAPHPLDRPPAPPDAGKIVALPVRRDEPLPREEKRRHLRSRG
jgi:protein ImuA